MKKKILFTLLTILLSPSLWAQEVSHWPFDFHAFRYDMTANVVLQVSGTTLTDYANYEVAAFCNDECRGIADFQKVGDTQTQIGYLRIYSNNTTGDKITFKAYDKNRQREMIIPDAEIAFAENTIQGMPSTPLTLVAYYRYTVTTAANGNGTVSDGAVVLSGNSIDLVATPSVGHHFVSWTIDGAVVSENASFAYTPEDDAALTANFAITQYTVKFVADGNDVYNEKQDYGSPITAPTDPEKEGYTFTGWSPELDATVPANDVTYTAQFSINEYTMTFVLDNGEENVVKKQEYASALTAPEPVKAGYTFTGWSPSVPATVPASDETFTAQWQLETYTISYELNGGTVSTANPTSYNVESQGFTLNNPTREGYTFLGWTGTNLDNPSTTVAVAKGSTGNRSYTAQWEANKYQITFVWEGGSQTSPQEFGQPLEVPTPERTGYSLAGWDPELPETVPAADKIYTAKWEANTYQITYVLNGGTVNEANPATYTIETADITLNNPTREGYQFTGWTSADFVGTNSSVTILKGSTGDRTYTANWSIDSYEITYDLNGGKLADGVTNPSTYSVESDDITLNNPTREGYTFLGWNGTGLATTTEQVTIAKGSTGARSYTATWQVNQYTVTFIVRREGLEDDIVQSQTLDFGAVITFPENNPTWDGHEFTTWRADKAPGEGGTVPAYDLTYYSAWDVLVLDLSYELDGQAYGDVVKVNFGATIEKKADPEARDGYSFSGWEGFPASGTMPAYDLVIKGTFNPIEYSITYNLAEGSLDNGETNPQSYNIESENITLKNPTRTGYTFAGWTGTGLEGASTNVTIAKGNFGTREYTATWTVNQYTMTFVFENGEANVVKTQVYASALTAPENLAKTGFTFKSWTPEVPTTVPAADQTFTAQWERNSYLLTFVVDGEKVSDASIAFEGAVTAPANPTKTGYEFKGWGAEIPEKMPAGDLTFTAVFEPIEYTISYVLGDGALAEGDTNPASYTIESEDITLKNPSLVGYTFKGWQSTDLTEPSTEVKITKGSIGNRTYTAVWEINKYSITFVLNNGEEDKVFTQNYNTAITAPTDFIKTGYTFTGWDQEIPETMPAENMTITAQWTINQYTITFDTDGGSEIAAITQDYNTAVTAPEAPTKEGYTFSGWDKAIPDTIPAENMTIKAQWTINKYTITFDTDGGSEIAAITQDYASTITAPANPTKTGYVFLGWDKTIPETMPADDMTITARWQILQFTITFDTDGGSSVADITQNYNTAITAPEAPTKEGYTFSGWDKVIPETMPAENVTIKATWTINQYTITFVPGNGEENVVKTQDYGTELTAPEAPTKTGYTFKGWDKEVPETMPAADMTITALWDINQYTITFDTDGGSEVAAITQDYASAVTAPEAPTKEGYTFSGWDKVIPETMPAENVTIKATWTINQYTMIFVLGNGEENVVKTQDYGTELTAPEAPTKEGHTFTGWSPEVPTTVPAEDQTFTAQFSVNTYVIRYYDEEGQLLWEDKVEYGAAVELREYTPADPNRFTFLEWIGEKFETMPAHDLEYRASLQDGISAIFASGVADVYTLNGTKVRSKASVKDLQNLPAGTYIIRGKKVMLK